MTVRGSKRNGRRTARAGTAARRRGLTHAKVMDEALRLIEREGLDSFSMRRLGAELGVEAMALYRYVDAKEALLDGVSAQLWSEVRVPDAQAADWKHSVRTTARSLREVTLAHPNVFPLLLGRNTLSEPALRAFDALIRTFQHAGFDSALAGQALGTLVAYAVGYAMVELTCGLGQPELAARRCSVPGAVSRFANVSNAIARCNPDAQFDFGLDTLIRGLDLQRRGRSDRRKRALPQV